MNFNRTCKQFTADMAWASDKPEDPGITTAVDNPRPGPNEVDIWKYTSVILNNHSYQREVDINSTRY